MTLTAARQVADAVLYEGYLLYPYRATSSKNQVRWQFGVLGPTGAPSVAGEDPSMQVECLLTLDPASGPFQLSVYLRFLQVLERRVRKLTPGGLVEVPELQVSGARWIPWQEATAREVPVLGVSLDALAAGFDVPISIPGGDDHEDLYDGDVLVGRLLRSRRPLTGLLALSVRDSPAGPILRVRMTNMVTWDGAMTRAEVSRDSFIGTHLLMEARGGTFVSLTEDASVACQNSRCWPVLVSADDGTDALLVAPIILPDHPTIAPESAGDLFDSTEIDEILTLRIMTLTDDEKIAARGTDARAGAIIDRSDDMPPEIFERLHGAARQPTASPWTDPVLGVDAWAGANTWGGPGALAGAVGEWGPPEATAVPWWDPGVDASVSPERDTVLVAGVAVGKGSRVRLRPLPGGDAQDMFVAGMIATVTGVYLDVDGGTHVAVTVDDDPASELHEWYGRFSYFRPEEVEPLP